MVEGEEDVLGKHGGVVYLDGLHTRPRNHASDDFAALHEFSGDAHERRGIGRVEVVGLDVLNVKGDLDCLRVVCCTTWRSA